MHTSVSRCVYVCVCVREGLRRKGSLEGVGSQQGGMCVIIRSHSTAPTHTHTHTSVVCAESCGRSCWRHFPDASFPFPCVRVCVSAWKSSNNGEHQALRRSSAVGVEELGRTHVCVCECVYKTSTLDGLHFGVCSFS